LSHPGINGHSVNDQNILDAIDELKISVAMVTTDASK